MPKIITLAGEVGVVAFHEACDVAEQVSNAAGGNVDVEVLSYFEPDYNRYLRKKAVELGGKVYAHAERLVFFVNDTEYVGGLAAFTDFAKAQLGVDPEEVQSGADVSEAAAEALAGARADTGHSFCYFELKAGSKPAQRVVFELYDEVCPLAVTNFKKLCDGNGSTGKSYRNSEVHRVVPGGWFQGGDLKGGAGDQSEAADGGVLPDESFAVKFEEAGILAMANDGPHTNGSQFFVTFDALPWMDCQAVAFGRMVQGLSVLDDVEKVPTTNERPTNIVRIVDSGVIA